MAESSVTLENDNTPKIHPSKETIRHLRHQIVERMPGARRVFDKSGTTPTPRELINSAGEQLRREMESDYDVLTGLLNKRGYEKQVRKAVAKAHAENTSAAVAVVDLDRLKRTNDTLGHDVGDLLIQAAAEVLRKASREDDVVARMGGDEYRVFLTNTTSELASAWEQRVRGELETRGISASIGVYEVDLGNIGQSSKTADELMYTEKRRKKHSAGKVFQILTRARNILRRAA